MVEVQLSRQVRFTTMWAPYVFAGAMEFNPLSYWAHLEELADVRSGCHATSGVEPTITNHSVEYRKLRVSRFLQFMPCYR